MIAYYKANIKVLEFDENKDIDLIRFNHYLMKKENLQRLKREVDKGYFYLSLTIIEKDLNFTRKKVRNLISKFVELGIITEVEKGNSSSKKSIYSYNSSLEGIVKGIDKDIQKGIVKCEYFNTSKDTMVIDVDIDKDIVKGNSKKELLKISSSCCLEEPHKNLENEIVEGAFQQKIDLEDERVALVKSYGFNVSNAQEKMIQTLEKDRLLQAIEISVAQEGKSFSYIYKVYLDNKKASTIPVVDALSSNAQSTKTKVDNSISQNNKKQKSNYNKPKLKGGIGYCKTHIEFEGKLVDTDDLSEDDFNRIIEERQKLKWA